MDIVRSAVLRSDSLEKALHKSDVVFHNAVCVTVAPDKQRILESINIIGTQNVCDTAPYCHLRYLVHFGSIEVISDERRDPPLVGCRQLIRPLSRGYPPFARSKTAGQRVAVVGGKLLALMAGGFALGDVRGVVEGATRAAEVARQTSSHFLERAGQACSKWHR